MSQHASSETDTEEMEAEYHFDYAKAQPNRFALRGKQARRIIVLEPDVAEVFTTPESVNAILRAIIANTPRAAE